MSKKEGLSPAAPEARAFKTIITHKKSWWSLKWQRQM